MEMVSVHLVRHGNSVSSEWHQDIRKSLVEPGIDKNRPPWDKDWCLHDPSLIRQGGRRCPRVPDVGFTKRSNQFASLKLFPFTKSSALTWSSPQWRRRGSNSRIAFIRRL